MVVDNDLKDAPARTPQGYLRIWPDFADQARRRTGARFIVSLAAVFDFDTHGYHPLLVPNTNARLVARLS
jgi:hypothetical protein